MLGPLWDTVGVQVMFTNHSCEVVDAVTLDFVKPIGDTVPISTILQKKIMMLAHLILQLVLCVI